MEKRLTKQEKKQLWIFVAAAFGLPLLMGVLMGINFYRGADVSVFPNAQMYYPAAGVMLAVLLTRKPEDRVPVKFYTGFLVLTGILMVLCVVSVFLPQVSMAAAINLVLIVGSLISWVLLLLEKKEIRRNSAGEGAPGKTVRLREKPGRESAPGCGFSYFYFCISCAFF